MQFVDSREGNIYAVPFASQAVSTAGPVDLVTLKSPSGMRVQLLDITLGQSSSNPSAIQALGLMIFTGSSSTASTGATITAQNQRRWSGAPTAGTSCNGLSTSLLSTASATLVLADAFEANSGKWRYRPSEEGGVPIVLNINQRMNLRLTTPSLALTMFGSVTIKELGAGLPA